MLIYEDNNKLNHIEIPDDMPYGLKSNFMDAVKSYNAWLEVNASKGLNRLVLETTIKVT